MPKCFLYNLIMIFALGLFGVGGVCFFVLEFAPRRWLFTKVGLMILQRWRTHWGDMDIYNRLGKILYVVCLTGMMGGFAIMSVVLFLQELGIFGVGCK